MTLYLRVGARSDVGLVREGNEDSLFAGHRLMAVADGVGGAAYGEVASATTIDTLAPLDEESTDALDDPLEALRAAIIAANERLRTLIDRDPKLVGMGTTLTALLWSRQRLALAQVGDSRAYRLRAGVLEQVSHDQTFVQTLVDEGRITADQAINHPQRNIILNAMDGREDVEPVLDLLDPEPGDRYLVCSDGLSDYVLAAEVTVAAGEGDPQQACERLVDLALEAGAPDNVSCVVAEVVETAPAADDRLPIIGGAVALPAYQSPDDDRPTTEFHSGGASASAPAPPPARTQRHAAESSRSGIGRRLGIVIGVVVVLVAAAVIGTWVYSRHQYYVAAAGTTPGRSVAIYQGVHGHALGFGSHIRTTTDLPVTALPQDERQQVDGGGINASGAAGAQQVVENLRQDACALYSASATPVTAPTARATPSVKATPSGLSPTATPPTPIWCTP